MNDRGGPTEGVATEAPHDEIAQAEVADSPDTLWVLSDPFGDDFGQTVEASSDLHAIGDGSLSRGGSFVRLFLVKKLENSTVRCWKSWVPRILPGKPFSIRDISEQKVLGASTPTIRQTNLSQRLRETPLPRTFELAGLTQMKQVRVWEPGVMSCWKVHKKPFSDSVVSGPATALTVCRKMLQNGSDPKRFAEWVKELSFGRADRAWHEMHALKDIFYQTGC